MLATQYGRRKHEHACPVRLGPRECPLCHIFLKNAHSLREHTRHKHASHSGKRTARKWQAAHGNYHSGGFPVVSGDFDVTVCDQSV